MRWQAARSRDRNRKKADRKGRCPINLPDYITSMTKLAEIQEAILRLPLPEREELIRWLMDKGSAGNARGHRRS